MVQAPSLARFLFELVNRQRCAHVHKRLVVVPTRSERLWRRRRRRRDLGAPFPRHISNALADAQPGLSLVPLAITNGRRRASPCVPLDSCQSRLLAPWLCSCSSTDDSPQHSSINCQQRVVLLLRHVVGGQLVRICLVSLFCRHAFHSSRRRRDDGDADRARRRRAMPKLALCAWLGALVSPRASHFPPSQSLSLGTVVSQQAHEQRRRHARCARGSAAGRGTGYQRLGWPCGRCGCWQDPRLETHALPSATCDSTPGAKRTLSPLFIPFCVSEHPPASPPWSLSLSSPLYRSSPSPFTPPSPQPGSFQAYIDRPSLTPYISGLLNTLDTHKTAPRR